MSGGVANNKTLQKSFKMLSESQSIPLLVANAKQTGDNAGMIVFAAFVDPEGVVPDGAGLSVNPSWKVV